MNTGKLLEDVVVLWKCICLGFGYPYERLSANDVSGEDGGLTGSCGRENAFSPFSF